MKRHPIPLRRRGLGDLVHLVAAPIASTLDRALGTRLRHCPSCAARRRALNAITLFRGTSAPPPPQHRDTHAAVPHHPRNLTT